MHEILFIVLSYLLGSIPVGFIVFYMTEKKDIRREGSGNIGATNVFRCGGKVAGLSTLILDILKGFLPVIYGLSHFDYPVMGVLGGAVVITGHIFPLFLKFKGGKGVATFAGVLLAYSIPAFLIFFMVFILTVIATKYVSAGSMLGVISSFFFFLFSQIVEIAMIIFVVTVFIIIRHKTNLKKIFSNTENKLGFGKNG
ncbi:MAG: glycerol-3-phosphate 1-O-acyltransferase PlsY [Candidatus Aminicenantes bacterium]|nr:glycerol-3-phosphate 1-O-acyltransferase PlsY [Candidatus Aminicenantes bacterium]